jgi:hypothetical protein
MNKLNKIVNLFIFTNTLSGSDPIQQIRQEYLPEKISVPCITKNLYEYPIGYCYEIHLEK